MPEFVASSIAGLGNDGHGATSAGGGLMLAAEGFGNRGTCGGRKPINLLNTTNILTNNKRHITYGLFIIYYIKHLPNISQLIKESTSVKKHAYECKPSETSAFRLMCPKF
jgi:hypothetical protein